MSILNYNVYHYAMERWFTSSFLFLVEDFQIAQSLLHVLEVAPNQFPPLFDNQCQILFCRKVLDLDLCSSCHKPMFIKYNNTSFNIGV